MIKPDLIDLSKIKGKKILAFGAHSDDLEFCAGGTLLSLSKNNQIEMIVVTDGNMGTHDHDQDHSELISQRMNEARKGGEHMGVQEIRFWSYPDLDLINRKKRLLRQVVKEMLTVKPDMVMTFDPWGRYDPLVHPDHRVLAWAVVEGVMMSTLPKWIHKQRLGRKHLNPKPEAWLMCPAEANVVVNITSIWHERLDLLKVFESQFDNDFQWERVTKVIGRMFREVGETVGVEYGEGFRILEYTGEYKKTDTR